MSRFSKKPIAIPSGVDVDINDSIISIKGIKGKVQYKVHNAVDVKKEAEGIVLKPKLIIDNIDAIVGTVCAILKNMFCGVTKGFEKKLVLIGVGFKAQAQGKVLNLSLGFSHPIKFQVPEGITIETPTQTEILVRGTDKCVVGQVASEIRAFRPPEPYKGKGVRYEGEVIIQKEGKKK